MIHISLVYGLAGLLFAAIAWLAVRDHTNPRRWSSGLFWALVAISFLLGDQLGDFGNGVLALALALLAGMGGLGRGKPPTSDVGQRRIAVSRHPAALPILALVVPGTALVGTILLKRLRWDGAPLVDPTQVTPVALALGVLLALVLIWLRYRPPPLAPLEEARRLMEAVGWAAFLPQMLAALGAVFAAAGVGDALGRLIVDFVPVETRLTAVATYAAGMALLTALMGNAFAAFPVMTAAVGLPIVVGRFGGDPAAVSAIGMLSGFCGTLVTPMAANFNLVPAALLELRDRHGVIRVQAPTALMLLAANIALMDLLAFRSPP